MRWRDVKQNRANNQKNETHVVKSADVPKRLKAFLVDIFMINIPILYIVTYLILDGKESFQENQIAIFVCTVIFGLILSLFLSRSTQTPGYKAYDIKLVDSRTGGKIGFFRCFCRFLCFVVAGCTFVGLFACFFRQDGKGIHDILAHSIVIDNK